MSRTMRFVSAGSSARPIQDPERPGKAASRGRLAIGALTMFAAVLWFWDLGSKSLFRDEAFTASTVLGPWGEFFKLSVEHESNGVLHALLLRVLTVFGDSEVLLRSLSVLSLVALVPIVGAIGWRLASPRVGVLASALLVVNGSVAANAQNARTYTLSMLIAGLATLLFVLDVEQPRRATVLGWSLCCVLLAYAHIVGVLLVLCHLVSLWFLPRSQRTVRRHVIAAAVVLLASLPLAVLITGHNEGRPSQGAFRPGAYRDVLFTITGRAGLIGLAAFAIMGFFAVRSTARVWRRELHGRQPWAHALLLSWAGLPPLTLIAISPVSPMVIGRYVLFCLPGILLYAAVGLDDAVSTASYRHGLAGLARYAPAALALVAGAYGLRYWYSDGGSEDWRGAASHVFDQATPQDRILFANDSVRLFFEYYRRFDTHATMPQPVYPPEPWGSYQTGDHTYESFDREIVDQLVAEPAGKVWVVIGLDHDNTAGVPELLSPLTADYSLVDRQLFRGHIEVLLFEPS